MFGAEKLWILSSSVVGSFVIFPKVEVSYSVKTALESESLPTDYKIFSFISIQYQVYAKISFLIHHAA